MQALLDFVAVDLFFGGTRSVWLFYTLFILDTLILLVHFVAYLLR